MPVDLEASLCVSDRQWRALAHRNLRVATWFRAVAANAGYARFMELTMAQRQAVTKKKALAYKNADRAGK